MAGIDCGENCVADFSPNTEIVLTATHPEDLRAQWAGCASNTTNECTLTLTSNAQVEVKFVSKVNENESNDSFTEANFIATSSDIIGFFNSENDEDYYKIEVTDSGTFHAAISHIQVRSSMYLYDSLQQELTKATKVEKARDYLLLVNSWHLLYPHDFV